MSLRFDSLRSDRPIMVLDLETTGTRPQADRILEIGLMQIETDGQVVTCQGLVNPGCPIPPEATAVHGIRDEDVASAPSFRYVAPLLGPQLQGHDLVGFGIKWFDLPLLQAEFDRVGYPFDLGDARVIDVKEIFHSLEPRDLSAAVRMFCGQDHAGAHGALADVVATAAVLEGMLSRRRELPRDVESLSGLFRDVDVAGMFRMVADEPAFAFGKHAGRPLSVVAREDAGYLYWLLRGSLLSDARQMILRALAWI